MNRFLKKITTNEKVQLYKYDKEILQQYIDKQDIKKNRESYHSYLLDLYSNKKSLTLGEFKRLYSLTK
jgi:hypothetical protein